jgi:hypothetical protein
MDRNDLAERIFQEAESYANHRQMRFGPGAREFFDQHAQNAANEMRQQPSISEGHVRAMIAVFERLVDEMISASKEIPGYASANPGTIGEDTLAAALRKLCPIFPFC